MKTLINNSSIKLLLIICVIGSLLSCEQIVDIPIEEYDKSIVIFGVLEQDSVPKIFVSEANASIGYVDKELEYSLIKDAKVEITDGRQTWQLKPDSVIYIPPDYFYKSIYSGGYYYGPYGENNTERELNTKPFYAFAFSAGMQLEGDKEYTITVNKNGKTASATKTVVKRLENVIHEFSPNNINRIFSTVEKRLGQYYRGIMKYNQKAYICSTYDFQTTEPAEVLDSVILDLYEAPDGTRKFVEDEPVMIPFYIDERACYSANTCMGSISSTLDSIEIQIAVQLIDSSMVNFVNQLDFQYYSEYIPFLEPAPVDNNVENGIGLLSTVSTSKWESFWVNCK